MYEDASASVIIPALNEERAIAKVLDAIPTWVDRVVVVDNGSTDQTAAIARRGGAHVITQPERGYGAACLAGIAAARDADILVFLDGDFSDHPEQMDRLVSPVARQCTDLVIGSRVTGRSTRGALSLPQRFGNALACKLIHAFWGHRYTDLGPFRAIRASALASLRMDDRTYGWTIQMQIRALRARLRVSEVPVNYRPRIGESKISGTVRGVMGAATKILATIAQERWRSPAISDYRASGEHAIVFTRFPEPGATKTRLIPALGPARAAVLQRSMAKQTLQATDELLTKRGVTCEIRFTGGDAIRMADVFGVRRSYMPQGHGNLGSRMYRALGHAFARGAKRAVVVGTDCPQLDANVLGQAFDALRTKDCVIGPARDGGYYLIGLRRLSRTIFEGIDWGCAIVCDQTRRRAAAAGLSLAELKTLSDVDRPSDLTTWQQHRRPTISVIIPALNEAQTIERSVRSAFGEDVEVIVVDGGSRDGTPALARAVGARLLDSSPGRARQMNTGAATARGSILLFLHGDTLLPGGFARCVYELLDRPGVSAGAFRLRIAARHRSLRLIESLVRYRSAYLQCPYGDQAIFVKATVFQAVGGYPDWPILEDHEIVRRLRRIGRIAIAPLPATTSARRWLADGVWRTTIINQACLIAFRMGVSPQRILDLRENSAPRNRRAGRPDRPHMNTRVDGACPRVGL